MFLAYKNCLDNEFISEYNEKGKNKNDFLTYENCLDNEFISEYSEKFKIKQVFIVSIINDNPLYY